MKRKFDFRLERVLRVRAIEERVARGEWSVAQAALREAESERNERSQGLREARRSLGAGRASGAITPERSLLVERTLDAQVFGLSNAIERAHGKLVSAERLAATWRHSERDRRGLAELKRRALESHRLKLEAKGNAEMDETAIGRMLRARGARQSTEDLEKDSENCSRSDAA